VTSQFTPVVNVGQPRDARTGDDGRRIATANQKRPPLTVRNMSPKTVTIRCGGSSISLPPLADRRIEDQSVRGAIERLAQDASPYLEIDAGAEDSDDAAIVVGVTFWAALIGAFVVGSMTDGIVPVVGYLALCVVIGIVVARMTAASWIAVGRWAREKSALVAALVVGFAIPATVLVFATQLFDQLRESPSDALDAPLNRMVTYRVLQAVFLGIATTFPALLYFLFDRQNSETLRSCFLLALFRLDRRIETADDWRAKYGRQITEAFGKHRSHGATRLIRAHRSPVIIATIVLAIGWILAFLNLDAVSVDGSGEILTGGSLLRLFEPERGVVAFGFLGAYFFGVNTVLRSYLRGDLRPKAYSQITTRVLVVVVLSSLVAITSFGDSTAVLAVAFFAGIVPDTVLQWIWELTRRGLPSARLDEPQPLTELEGIDLYERTRLEEEGVTNVEALAHGDLVDLLLQTRIPPGRLVDWVDQAVLHLHLRSDQPTRTKLRDTGIRTATDLLTAADSDQTTVLTALGAAKDEVGKARLSVLLQALADDEWVQQLRDWRTSAAPGTVTIPDVGVGEGESTLVVSLPEAPALAGTR
jgi:hypothetical protein